MFCMVFKVGDKPWNFSEIDNDEADRLVEAYLGGMSGGEAASFVGIPRERGYKILRDRGVLRPKGATNSANARKKRVYNFDADFWLEWTPQSAWLWGLIYGDGWVRPREVWLSGTEEVVSKARTLCGGESKIYERKWCFTVSLGGVELVEIAERMVGLVPGPKSGTIRWPLSMPAELDPHFARGLWDSDGGWSNWTRSGLKQLVGTYSSKSIGMIEDFIHRSSVCDAVGRPNIREGKVAQVRFFSSNAVRVGRWMYDQSDDGMRNDKKYVVFQGSRECQG